MRIQDFACAAVAIAALTACWSDDRPIQWTRPRSVLGPLPLKTQVAYVDSALDRVVLIDVAGDAPVISHTQVGRRALIAVPSADRHELYVITRGEQAIHAGEIDQAPQLWVVDAQHPGAPAVGYPIGSPFDRIAVSPDGKRAITYFSAGGTDPDGFFRNPNELAVIDLASPPGDANPALVTIRSFGSAPDGISLSPPMVLPGASDATPRTFAFILSAGTLTVLDATHPERREISIRLDLGGPPVIPRQVVFAPGSASAYVRSDGARDVLQVLLDGEGASPTDLHANDVRAQVAELGAGGGPTDIAVYDDARGRRQLIAATPGTGEVVVIDADTAQFRSIPIADPIDRILVFPTGPDAGGTPHEALFAAVGAGLPRLYTLSLDHLDDPLVPPQLTTITLDKPVRDVVAVPGRDLAMIVHDDARTVLGILDLSTGTTAPLLGVGKLDAYDFSPNGSHLIGATTGVARIGFVALDNLHPTDFRLDDPPAHVLATANGKIFVDHADPLGRATIIPSPTAGRGDAVVLSGYLTADLLDEEP
ncbi:MAG TPA: hypothetical protein VFK02_23515 [Kofleriaceae bacterium]|nr:hypothetical protein [Kofleriaceae bacterium]